MPEKWHNAVWSQRNGIMQNLYVDYNYDGASGIALCSLCVWTLPEPEQSCDDVCTCESDVKVAGQPMCDSNSEGKSANGSIVTVQRAKRKGYQRRYSIIV